MIIVVQERSAPWDTCQCPLHSGLGGVDVSWISDRLRLSGSSSLETHPFRTMESMVRLSVLLSSMRVSAKS